MTAAIVALAVAATSAIGLSVFLAAQWRRAVRDARSDAVDLREEMEIAAKAGDKLADLRVEHATLRGQYDQALGVVDLLKQNVAVLESALNVAQESYASLVTSVDSVKSPQAANVLRMAVAHLDRLRVKVPEVSRAPAAAAAEGGDGDGEVHGTDPGHSPQGGSDPGRSG